MSNLRVFITDDHAILREGVRLILARIPGIEVVGEAGDGLEALQAIENLKPDLVILDISLPSLSGVELARKLRKYQPETKLLVLSRHDGPEYVEQLVKLGIHGYVLKEEAGSDLIKAVEVIQRGQTYLSPRITSQLVSGFDPARSAQDPFHILSNREREILKLVAEGKSNARIGKELLISPKTVKVHRANVMKKLDVHKVADLVKYAIKAGIVEA